MIAATVQGVWDWQLQAILMATAGVWTKVLVANLLAVSISDILWRKVSNEVVLGGLVAALCAWAVAGGWPAFAVSLGSFACCFAFALVFYAFGVIGAADVKVYGAYGAWAGPAGWVSLCVYTAIFAGLLGVVAILRQHQSYCHIMAGLAHPQGALNRARGAGQTVPLTVAFSGAVYLISIGACPWPF